MYPKARGGTAGEKKIKNLGLLPLLGNQNQCFEINLSATVAIGNGKLSDVS